MGRKKRGSPVKLDAAKRQCMAWNMLDLQHDVVLVDDNDPMLQEEQQNASLSEPATSYRKRRILTEQDLQQLNKTCLCQLVIHDKAQFKERQWHCEIASFTLNLESPHFESICTGDSWKFFVSCDTNDHVISAKNLDGPSSSSSSSLGRDEAVGVTCPVPSHILSRLREKTYILENGGLHEQKLTVKIHVVDGLVKLQFGSEGIPSRKVNTSLQQLMAYFHGFHYSDYKGEKFTMKHNVDDLFEEVRRRHQEHLVNIGINPQHPSLRPRLRPYQRDAVIWMLSRENYNNSRVADANELHDLYQEFITPDGQLLYYNRHGGQLVRDRPLAQPALPGGILADEMGLGKTVEVLACMLCNQRSDLPPVEELLVAVTEDDAIPDGEDATSQVKQEMDDREEKPDVECLQLKNEPNENKEVLPDTKDQISLETSAEAPCATSETTDAIVNQQDGDENVGSNTSGATCTLETEVVNSASSLIHQESVTSAPEIEISTDSISETVIVESEVQLMTEGDDITDHNYAMIPESDKNQDNFADDPDCGLTNVIKCSKCGADASAEATALFPWGEPNIVPNISNIDFTCKSCIEDKDQMEANEGVDLEVSAKQRGKKGKQKSRGKKKAAASTTSKTEGSKKKGPKSKKKKVPTATLR